MKWSFLEMLYQASQGIYISGEAPYIFRKLFLRISAGGDQIV
jgi:hypothetical protein